MTRYYSTTNRYRWGAVKQANSKAKIRSIICPVIFMAMLLSGCILQSDESRFNAQNTSRSTEFMLTFDDGPLPDVTEQVLDMLATLKAIDGKPVKAGFFLLADAAEEFWQRRVTYAPYELWTDKGSIEKYPEIARRIKQEGHVIGNHTSHHPWYWWPWHDTPEFWQTEFSDWEAVSVQVLGASSTRLFRPPYGIITENIRSTANQMAYQIVLGESAGDAIPNVSVDTIKKKTESILQEWNKPYPCILIFHDNRPITHGYLSEIVYNLQVKGFRLVHFEPERL